MIIIIWLMSAVIFAALNAWIMTSVYDHWGAHAVFAVYLTTSILGLIIGALRDA